MTNAEFKAWFEGFCEGVDKAPTEKQWKKIKEKVAAIDGRPVTREVINHWWNPYRTWTTPPVTYRSATVVATNQDTIAWNGAPTQASTSSVGVEAMQSLQATLTNSLYELGRAEAHN